MAFSLYFSVALLIVAIVAAASGACDTAGAGRAAVHDVKRARARSGDATLMMYELVAAGKGKESSPSSTAAAAHCSAICLSQYAKGDELVGVVPACGHLFHAGCDGGSGRARSAVADSPRCGPVAAAVITRRPQLESRYRTCNANTLDEKSGLMVLSQLNRITSDQNVYWNFVETNS
ncbi:hypothetical protein ACP70R_025089 [Stipagrostis hirtigluma subsp. patula]